MNRYLLLVLLISVFGLCSAQNEASFWYFGRNAGLQFNSNTGTVSALTNGRLNTLEGCTTISDRDGNLLFYSDGRTIWNKNHSVMANGNGLKGDESSTSSGLIVPKPQDPNFYYIFTVDEPHHLNSSSFPNDSDGDGVNDGLMYSRININDNNGLGAVDSAEKNIPLITYDTSNLNEREFKSSEKITAVRADDCSSFWVITHFVNRFYAFKVDTNGVSKTPVISTVGPEVPVSGYRRNALGYLKASPDGSKLVAAHFSFATQLGDTQAGGVYLFDFNNDTGEVSNNLELYSPQNNKNPYGVEFSAENKKVYATVDGDGSSQLLQWDLEAANIASSLSIIHSSNRLTAGALQLGIDRRIYRAQVDFNNFNLSGQYLGIIENPEANGSNSQYNERGILLDVTGGFENLSSIGLPPFIQSLFNSQIDIIRNGESTTELKLCNGDVYTLAADNIPGADYTWLLDGNPLAETGFELQIDTPGFYECFIEPNNGECPIEGSAVVGVFDIPIANNINDIVICDEDNDGTASFDFVDETIQMLGSQDASKFQVRYFLNQNDADLGFNSVSLPFTNIQNPQLIVARIENVQNSNCYSTSSFEINVFNSPIISNLRQESCDTFNNTSDGIAEFNLSNFSIEIENLQNDTPLNISYHRTPQEAENNQNPITSNYTNTTAFNDIIHMRVENALNPSCFKTAELNLIINPLPNVVNTSIFQCDEDGISDGFTRFNLNQISEEISNNLPNRVVQFYLNITDAETNQNEVDAEDYTNTTPIETLITRVTNTETNCFNFGEVTLEVSQTSANNASLTVCDDDGLEDGFYEFDLREAEQQILNSLPNGLEVAFYETYDDALLETNSVDFNYTNVSPYQQTIFVRVEDNNACYGINEVDLNVLTLPQIEMEFETIYCLNSFPETITLTGGVLNDEPNNYFYEWSTGETTSEILINEPGTYSVVVTNTLGCSKERIIQVIASNTATIESVEVIDASENNSISISVSGEGDYEYALNDFSGPYQDDPFFDDLVPDLYTLFVRDKNGCGITETEVSVIGFPRFFTPNGDGNNDLWQIRGINSTEQISSRVLIYDRYGKLLKELNPLGPGWDGTYNNNLLPSNDYWFTVTLQDGRKFTSHFTLKR